MSLLLNACILHISGWNVPGTLTLDYIQPCCILVCSQGLWGVLSPCSIAGDGFAVVDFLGLGFPTWARISDLFWKKGRGESISLPQGKEIINNSGVGTCLRLIPE